MSVISITITESDVEIIAGIPQTVALSSNIPATIFYTLDGTEPTTSSSVYTTALSLPTNQNAVTLKVFATDGVNSSPILTWEFKSDFIGDRRPRDEVTNIDNTCNKNSIFASRTQSGSAIYGNTAGITVDAPDLPGIGDGYDGTGTGKFADYTDLPLDDYEIIYSETNYIGETGKGLGTLPAHVTIRIPFPVQEPSVGTGSNKTSSLLFNPKSLVIFQDSREPDPIPTVNRPFFSLENQEKARYGVGYFTTAFEGNTVHGSALKSQYNPTDGTITYYYRDSLTNRWIISKTPYTPQPQGINNLSRIVFGRGEGVGKVFKWILFKYRTLW